MPSHTVAKRARNRQVAERKRLGIKKAKPTAVSKVFAAPFRAGRKATVSGLARNAAASNASRRARRKK